MQIFRINKFLDLRFEDGKTNIYINNKLFNHCKSILINIQTNISNGITEINSIDEIVENVSGSFEIVEEKKCEINPSVIFWAHCSNLQIWYENNYNSKLMHSNLAFPLLKELTKVGDLKAKRVFKEEIAKRVESGNLNVIRFLLYNNYLDYLNKEELDVILQTAQFSITTLALKKLRGLIRAIYAHYREIKDIIDIFLFIDLNYNKRSIHHILTQLSKYTNIDFAAFLLLHLNFKEITDFKIPYGKYLSYFEDILNLIYEIYPEIDSLIRIIDSGFMNGSTSLDDKESYGFVPYPGNI